METILEWSGFEWMNGLRWGQTHPAPKYVWYADKYEANVLDDGSLKLDINNYRQYFPEIDQTKLFGCGYITSQEMFKYGNFHFEYILPIGIHLWPAIWLCGVDSWPPEIDIVEGWTGDGYFLKNKPNYKKFVGFNRIHPGVFYGRDENDKPIGKGYGSFGTDDVTYCWLQDTDGGVNTCDLYWAPNNVKVKYNGKVVMDIKDKTILDGLNGRMSVILDLAAGNNMTQSDYQNYKTKGSPFIIKKFTYKPLEAKWYVNC